MIDIFIPFWGRPSQLFDAVDSVRGQSSPDWRLTVVDDCYPEDVSKYFDGIDDPRVRFIRNKTNLGIIANFAKCQSLAEGEYTVFMGCDDLLKPNYVSLVKRTVARVPGVEIIQPGVEVIDENGQTIKPLADRVKAAIRPSTRDLKVVSGEQAARSLLIGDWLYWPSLAFETDGLQTVEFMPNYEIILDLGLILDLLQNGGSIAIVSEIAFAYRRHSQSLSSQALLNGPRFQDERRFYSERAAQMKTKGWPRAARAARTHLTSRMHALAMVPAAMSSGSGIRSLLQHTFR